MDLRKGMPVGTRPPGPGLIAINIRYFAVRSVIFMLVLAGVLLLGLDGLLGFALAIVLSGLVSYPVALRQRRAVLDALEGRRSASGGTVGTPEARLLGSLPGRRGWRR